MKKIPLDFAGAQNSKYVQHSNQVQLTKIPLFQKLKRKLTFKQTQNFSNT